MSWRWRLGLATVATLVATAALAPTLLLAHGDEELPSSEEAEIEMLAEQPARILAQQALALLEVRSDTHEAAVRLDAALESSDQSDIDAELLAEATETLDGGDPASAAVLLDQALSRPLGADQGKALHEAGREFSPGSDAQEVVAIVLGGLLLVLGLVALRRRPGDAASA